MKEFGWEVFAAVRSGKLKQPFRASAVKVACPGWSAYATFLGKHAVGNGKTTELFIRVERGLYRVNPKFA
jgi:hypothetical protein